MKNFTAVYNPTFDIALARFSPNEYMVFSYIYRQTVGYNAWGFITSLVEWTNEQPYLTARSIKAALESLCPIYFTLYFCKPDHMEIMLSNDDSYNFHGVIEYDLGKPLTRRIGRYYGYLQTDEWREKSLKAFKRVLGKCQECGRASNLVAHHLTYERCGDELPEDLKVLCQPCHDKNHGR